MDRRSKTGAAATRMIPRGLHRGGTQSLEVLAPSAPEPAAASPRMAYVRQEIKQLGSDMRRDISLLMNEIGDHLREDVKHDMQKVLHMFGKVDDPNDSHAINGDVDLRSTGMAPLESSWDVASSWWNRAGAVPNLQGNARKKPFVKPAFEEGAWVATKPLNTCDVIQPGEEPPLLPPTTLPSTIADDVPVGMSLSSGKVMVNGKLFDTSGKPAAKTPSAENDGSDSGTEDSVRIPSPTDSRSGSKPWMAEGTNVTTASTAFVSSLRQVKSLQKEKEVECVKTTRRARMSLSREKARFEAKHKTSSGSLRQMTIAEFIQTSFFDNLVGGVILLNAAVIGIQTDRNARALAGDVPLVFYVFEQFFAAWFTLELSLRIYVYKIAFFKPCTDGWLWNYFDFIVVAAQLMEVFFELVARSADVNANNFRVLRVLRILRLVRILRVVRVLHLISELRAIVSSIMGSMKSLVWVVVLLLIMIYIVAVFFTQSITDHLVQAKEDDSTFQMTADEDALRYYFHSLGRAILTLWQSMSGGLDWDALAGPLFQRISFLTGFAFASFIAFALLALMNVVTGVFVQTALLSARDEEDSFMTSQIISLFNIADKDNSSSITWDEIVESLDDPSLVKEWKSIGVQAEDARYLFKLLDLENSGEVSFEEFMGGCLRLSGPAKAFDLLTVMQEQRANEFKLARKLVAMSEAVIDVHETVRNTQQDLINVLSIVTVLQRGTNNISDDISSLAYRLGSEFTHMKSTLQPLRMVEDLFSTDSQNLV